MSRSKQWFDEYQGYARAKAYEVARKLPRHVDVEDLIQYGYIGLADARKRFDPGRGIKFLTFAHYRIRGAIFDGLRAMTHGQKSSVDAAVSHMEAMDDFVSHHVAPAGAAESAESLAGRLSAAIVSVGTLVLAARSGSVNEGSVEPIDEQSASDCAADEEQRARLREARRLLPKRQARVLEMIYEKHLSFTEVARRLDVNKATISREHARAIEALRDHLTPKGAPHATGA